MRIFLVRGGESEVRVGLKRGVFRSLFCGSIGFYFVVGMEERSSFIFVSIISYSYALTFGGFSNFNLYCGRIGRRRRRRRRK
jgi:hypothetical protein